jgi:hypothetical protein
MSTRGTTRSSGDAGDILSLSVAAARLGVKRHQLAEWIRLGLVPAPHRLGRRSNGRPVAYMFFQIDLPELARLVKQLKKGVIPK